MTGENEMGLRKILDFTRLGAIVILLLHFYYYCYGTFQHWQLTHEISDNFLRNISKTGLFSSTWKSKLLALALLIISLIGAKGKKEEKISVQSVMVYSVTGLVFYFSSVLLLKLNL